MKLRDRLRAGTASYAHLIGGPSAAARADDYDRREDEEDKKDAKGAEGDKPEDGEDDDKKDAKSTRTEADDDDERAADDDGDDDGDKEEMRGHSSLAQARNRERARCSAIFMSRHAAGNPAVAAQLAFGTKLSRQEAIALLATIPVGPARGERAGRNPQLGPGGEPGLSSTQAMAASWDRSFAKARNPLGRRPA